MTSPPTTKPKSRAPHDAVMRRATPVLVLALLVAQSVPTAPAALLEASDTVHVTALAVGETADGSFVGVTAGVAATAIRNGSGQVFIDTKPLAQTDMQGSARLAARVAASTLGLDWHQYDFMVVFRSESTVVGGPSAGGVLALAMAVALQNLVGPEEPWEVRDDFAATGTINPDGTIGPVGGIPEKAAGAARAGIRIVQYPAGQTQTLDHEGAAVDMQDHCDDLGIRCRAAATLLDLIEGAVGIRLERPESPVPGTADYAALLGPSVEAQVDELAQRLSTLQQGSLSDAQWQQIQGLLQDAQGRLDDAQEALADERYYTAATLSFQGRIFVAQASRIADFLAAAQSTTVAEDAIETCRTQMEESRDAAYALEATHANALYAIGAAQVRAAQAESLYQQAAARAAAALSAQDLVQAIMDAAFCIERTETVTWWADLRDIFGPGTALEDPHSLATDVVGRAREMVTYAQAVLQGAGDLGDAALALAEADAHLEAGRHPGAIVRAVDAQTKASLVLQTTTGTLSQAVLDAATQTAADAIARARKAGVEPMLSVAQVELAADVADPAATLENLWSARSLALVPLDVDGAEPGFRRVLPWPGTEPVVSLAIGIAAGSGAGALLVGIVAVAGLARRDLA